MHHCRPFWTRRMLCAFAAALVHRSSSLVVNKPHIITSFRRTVSPSSKPLVLFSNMSSETQNDMSLNIRDNLNQVQDRIQEACAQRQQEHQEREVRLVAVSKTKPLELLQAAYDSGCRVFGENYAQELVEKVQNMPADIQWHYIGSLQSNKVNMLLRPFIYGDDKSIDQLTIETVSSVKLANKLNNAVSDQNKKLKIFVQVNTSNEDSKSGVSPGDECMELCQHIKESCPNLQLVGLMTIGAPGDLNCFQILRKCRDDHDSSLELSMGMSGDFEQAILQGATNVRVGSTIFGERDYSNKA